MESRRAADLLQSQLVRHPATRELFMIDRDALGGMLALAGPLRRAVWTGHRPRALISLGAEVDWFVRPAEPDADSDTDEAPGEDVIRAVLAWAERVAWESVAVYRRVDEFAETESVDEETPGEPRFVRTVYLLESAARGEPAAPTTQATAPAAEPEVPLWSGPGPVSLG